MKSSHIKSIFIVSVILIFTFFACNKTVKNQNDAETIISGKTNLLVDETLVPIIEDFKTVFEAQYKAKINLISKSEKESIIALSKGEADIIVLSRKLNKNELAFFKQKKINPVVTPFAIDALTFIKKKSINDTLINLADVINFVKGEKNTIKGLVFDNPNSSSVRFICELAGVEELPKNGVFSFNTNDEVIKHIATNEGMIGVVGLNWLSQSKPEMKQYVDTISVMYVKDDKGNYNYPSQERIATRKYPLARVLYIINCQGYEGLGMGFASFIAGEIGQRILLQSGLAPIREPSRNIIIRNQIEIKK